MVQPSTGSLNFLNSIRQDFDNGTDPNRYANILERLRILTNSPNEGESGQTTATFHALLRDLLPHIPTDTVYKNQIDLNKLLRKFPDLKEEYRLCLALADRHSAEQTSVGCRLSLGYSGKGVILAKSGGHDNFRTALKKTHQLFLSIVCSYFTASLEKFYIGSDMETFASLLNGVKYFDKYCYDDSDRKVIEKVYLAAQNIISPAGRNGNQAFEPFRETIGHYTVALHSPDFKFLTPESVIPIEIYRDRLEKFRERFKHLPSTIRDFQQKAFNDFRQKVFIPLLEEVFCIIGYPPCDYDFVALGSTAREEIRPYSDVEWIILIEDTKHLEYFKRLYRILDFLVLSMGEMENKSGIDFPSLHPNKGFYIECPGGDSHLEDSIGIPKKLAEHVRNLPKEMGSDPTSMDNMVLTTHSLATFRASPPQETNTPSRLFQMFKSEFKAILDEPISVDNDPNIKRPHREVRAFKRLRSRYAIEYPRGWGSGLLNKTVFELKEDFVQTLYYALKDLAIYFDIEESNTLDIVEKLADKPLEAFSQETKVVLIWAIQQLYPLQVGVDLDPKHGFDHDLLRRIYLMTIWPFYKSIENLKEPQDVKSTFVNLNFIKKTCELLTAVSVDEIKQTLPLVIRSLCELNVPFETHVQYYRNLGEVVCHNDEIRFSYLKVLKPLKPDYVELLEELPNTYGIRILYRKKQGQLRKSIETLSSLDTPQEDSRGISVKLISSFCNGRFLKADDICVLINENLDIQTPSASGLENVSLHNVNFLPAYGLHFKQEPAQALLEYAIHSLISRLVGNLTPTVELVRFEVTKAGKTRSFPVIISETFSGVHLNKRSFKWSDCDQEEWTKMFLATLITRPGDGRPTNYLIAALGKNHKLQVSCIDNDISLVEPLSEKKHFHFCSALFCLFAQAELDKKILTEFLQLDPSVILNNWLDELIEKEREWTGYFSEEERRQLHDLKNSCRLNILLPPGTVALIDSQILHLQKFIKERGNNPITAHHLLEQLMSLRRDNLSENILGRGIAKRYQTGISKFEKIDERLSWIVSRNVSESMSSAKADMASFGRMLTIDEIEKFREYSPENARVELFRNMLAENTSVLVFKKLRAEESVHGHFEGEPSIARQELILKAAGRYVQQQQNKPTAITLRSCAALNTESLLALLHDKIEYLEFRDCENLSDHDIQVIQEKCPNLRELYLSGCGKIKCIQWSNPVVAILPKYSLIFSKLRVFVIHKCSALQMIRILAPLLNRLELSQNTSLESVDAPSFFPRLLIRECSAIQSTNTEIEDASMWLSQASGNLRDDPEILLAIEKRRVLSEIKLNDLAFSRARSELRADEKVVLHAVKRNGKALKDASSILQNNEPIVLVAINQNASAFEHASEFLRKKINVALCAVRKDGLTLKFAGEILRGEEEVVLEAVTQNGYALQYAIDEIKAKPAVVEVAVRNCGLALQWAHVDLQGNEELAYQAVKQNGLALKYVSKPLTKKDRIVSTAIQQDGLALEYAHEDFRGAGLYVLQAVRQNGLALEYASTELRGTEEVVITAVTQNGDALQFASEVIRNKKSVALAAVNQNGLILKELVAFQQDEDVVLAAVQQNGMAIAYANLSGKVDFKKIFLVAVKQDGMALKHWKAIQQTYRDRYKLDDPEVVLEAVKQNGEALQYAGDLQNDSRIVLAAIEKDGCALKYAAKRFQKDKQYVSYAVQQNPKALKYADETVRKNKAVILQLVALHDGKPFQYVHESIRNDSKFIRDVVNISWKALGYATDRIKGERNILLDIVKKEGRSLEFSTDKIKRDKEVVREAVKNHYEAMRFANKMLRRDRLFVLSTIQLGNEQSFEFISKRLQQDPEFVLEAVRRNGLILKYLSDEFKMNEKITTAAIMQNADATQYIHEDKRKNKDFVLAILKSTNKNDLVQNHLDRDILLKIVEERLSAFSYLSEKLRSDETFMKAAVQQFGGALEFASGDLQAKREVVLLAVANFGGALRYASEDLRRDPQVVKTAVEQYGNALEHAPFLQDDETIVLAAIAQSEDALQFANKKFKEDEKIVLGVVCRKGLALAYVSDTMRDTKNVVLAAVTADGRALEFAGPNMKKDPDVLREAIKQNPVAARYAADAISRT